MLDIIDERIEAYFKNEANLHNLRTKILNLEGYRTQRDYDNELAISRAAIADDMAALRRTCKKAEEEAAELKRAAEKYKIEIDSWKSAYGKLDEIYREFLSLSDKHKRDIAGIFGGCSTLLDFLYGSIQKDHIEQLWDYICDELKNNDIDDGEANRLSLLFEFSYNAVNRSQYEPLYRRLVVPKGAKYDGDTMGRTPDSPQLGLVKHLIFAGFAYEVTGKVVRRSLVRLE